jgi:hypothetical protein
MDLRRTGWIRLEYQGKGSEQMRVVENHVESTKEPLATSMFEYVCPFWDGSSTRLPRDRSLAHPHEYCGATQIPTRVFSESEATARCTKTTTSPERFGISKNSHSERKVSAGSTAAALRAGK